MQHAHCPIAVLDSGLGGLTVASALRRRLPADDVIYFGDTARVPYGSKSQRTVTAFVQQIVEFLRPFHPKHVVIACNTATALALPSIARQFTDLSFSGVIEPGSRAAAAAAGTKSLPRIGVIATEATIRSRAYERALVRRRHYARLLMRPTPLLVPLIEEGRSMNDPLVELALKQYLRPFMDQKVDVLVLGCTHYPMLKPLIERIVGPTMTVIDSADRAADDVVARLTRRNMMRHSGQPGTLRCYVTDDTARFARLAGTFLDLAIDEPELVNLDEQATVSPALIARLAG